jgi:hypothetical protein
MIPTVKIFQKAVFSGLVMAVTTLSSSAQIADTQGFWNVETNVYTRDYSVIRFYTADNELIYEERLEGLHLDVSRKKTARMLTRTLRMFQNKSLVAGQLKGYSQMIAASIARERR